MGLTSEYQQIRFHPRFHAFTSYESGNPVLVIHWRELAKSICVVSPVSVWWTCLFFCGMRYSYRTSKTEPTLMAPVSFLQSLSLGRLGWLYCVRHVCVSERQMGHQGINQGLTALVRSPWVIVSDVWKTKTLSDPGHMTDDAPLMMCPGECKIELSKCCFEFVAQLVYWQQSKEQFSIIISYLISETAILP